MNIENLKKAKILAVLYNNSKPLGMGILHYDSTPMTEKKAQQLLDSGHTYFDYLYGRVMKIDLSSNELNTRLYNRDNGENAAENIIASIKENEK